MKWNRPPGGLALLGASLLLDLPSAIIRLVVAAVVLGLFLPLSTMTDLAVSLIAFGPALRSLLALLFPVPAGPVYRGLVGARRASGRELDAVGRAFALVPGTEAPSSLLVIDRPEENAWVLGSTLFLSRGLFEGPHLAAVVAHEAGHLATGDGQVALAAWWLPMRWLGWLAGRLGVGARSAAADQAATLARGGSPSRPARRGLLSLTLVIPARVLGAILLLLAGGLVPMLLRPAWAPYRRSREYAADAFAAAHGQGPALIDALGDWQILDVPAPWWLGRTHPYTEQRIDRLSARGR